MTKVMQGITGNAAAQLIQYKTLILYFHGDLKFPD